MSLLTALVALAADPVPPSSSSGPGPGGASARHHHNQGQPFTGWPLGDLEAPGALLAAAASLARRAANGDKELIFMATGSDANSLSVTNNSLVTLATLGLRRHVMLLADGWQTCEVLRAVLYGPCFWSSRMLRRQPADSITLRKFWDFRFRFYYIKKKYMALLVEGGYAVLQADTDTVWMRAAPLRVAAAWCGSGVSSDAPGCDQARPVPHAAADARRVAGDHARRGYRQRRRRLREARLARSRRRALVFQPTLERTRLQPHSAAFSRTQLYSLHLPPSYSRGALKTLHNTAFPP